MKKIYAIALLTCISLFFVVFMWVSEEQALKNIDKSVVNVNQVNARQVQVNLRDKNNTIENKLVQNASYLEPPKLEDLKANIYALAENTQFIQAIHDIEFGAQYKHVRPLINELFSRWVTQDPIAALNYSQILSGRYEDSSFRLYALEKAAIHSIADAQAWLYSNIGSKQETDLNTLAVYSGLSVNDPIAALQHIDEIENTYLKHKLELRAIAEWAKQEPEQAMAWLESESSFTHEIGINDAYVAVVAPIIESSPLQAESIILSMEPSPQKNTLVSVYAEKLAQNDAEAAMQWAQELSDSQAYNTAISTTLKTLAHTQSRQLKAIELARKESNPELRRHFVSQTIGYIAHSNPAVAASELSVLPFDHQQDIAIAIAYSFAEGDIENRRLWLSALPSEELKETVLRATSK